MDYLWDKQTDRHKLENISVLDVMTLKRVRPIILGNTLIIHAAG